MTLFPKKLIIGKVEITDTKTIAKTFNNFFVKIGSNLSLKIPKSDINFDLTQQSKYKTARKPFNGGQIFGSI